MLLYRDIDKIPFMEIQYEELEHNTEEITRQMIDYCNLDWDEHCLCFYDSDRVVERLVIRSVNQFILVL